MLIKCDKTGIEFEADSKRQKNHPRISALLNCASKDGNYNAALAACKAVKDRGSMTIDEAIQFINDRVSGVETIRIAKVNEAARREREIEQARCEAKEQRQAQNDYLRKHGYKWSKDYADHDEYEEGEPSVWNLYSPDGRRVPVSQALEEIKRGADVVLAELKVKDEAEKAARQARIDRDNADAKAHEAAKATVEALGHEVEAFEYKGFAVLYERKNYAVSTNVQQVLTGAVNGVACGVIYTYWGGHDWVEYVSYWCADPALAGLAEITREGLSKTLGEFFA